MKWKNVVRMSVFWMLSAFTVMQAVVYKAVSLRKGNLRRIVLFDYHRDFQGIVKTQKEMRDLLQAGRRLGASFLIEDRKEYTGSEQILREYNKRTEQRMQGYVQAMPTRTVVGSTAMWGLTARLRAAGIRARSLEVRHPIGLYTTGLYIDGDITRGLNRRLTLPVVWLLVSKVEAAVRASIAEIRHYNDGRLFNQLYNHSIKQAQNLLHQILNIKESIRIVLREKTPVPTRWMDDLSKTMLELTTTLLDAHIIHELAQQKNEPTAIVFAGGMHSQNIVNALLQDGFIIEREIQASQIPRRVGDEEILIERSIPLDRFFESLPHIQPARLTVPVQEPRVVRASPTPPAPRQVPRLTPAVSAPRVQQTPSPRPAPYAIDRRRIPVPTPTPRPVVVPRSRPTPRTPIVVPTRQEPVRRVAPSAPRSAPVARPVFSSLRPASVNAAVSKVLKEKAQARVKPPIKRPVVRTRK